MGRGRVWARRLVVVAAVVAAQVGFVVRGYSSDHKEFAFQMFPESSTWQADIVRVTADGRRVPVTRAVGRLPLVRAGARPRPARSPAGAATPTPGSTTSWRSSTRRSTTSPATRRATPRPRYLEAVVTTWHNTDDPDDVVLRSVDAAGDAAVTATATRPAAADGRPRRRAARAAR